MSFVDFLLYVAGAILTTALGLSRANRVSEQVSANVTQMLADHISTFEIYNEERCIFWCCLRVFLWQRRPRG